MDIYDLYKLQDVINSTILSENKDAQHLINIECTDTEYLIEENKLRFTCTLKLINYELPYNDIKKLLVILHRF